MAMDISILLAQFWGALLVILSLELLLRKSALDNLFKRVNDKTFMIISGYLALIIGLVTVILHNIWVADWRVVITVFGWLSLVKGVVRIGFPEITPKAVRAFKNSLALMKVMLIITAILGAWLLWVGLY
jgi:hypothetical protein